MKEIRLERSLPGEPMDRSIQHVEGAPPPVAGRYRLVRLLGEGAIGRVWEAVDLLLGCRVAVKRLRREWTHDRQVVERCKREVLAARRICHPNVCRVFDLVTGPEPADPASEEAPDVLVVMERVDGPTLANRLEAEGPLAEDEAADLGRDLCAALAATHEAGIVHRDLKPANLILGRAADGSLRPVLTDLGMARCLGGSRTALTRPGELLGSPAYASPEQVRGEEITPATDLFALGVVLYEASTGMLPFGGETVLEAALARLHGPPPPPSLRWPGLSARWDAIVMRCLALDPAERYPSATALRSDLERLRGTAVTTDDPKDLPVPPVPPSVRGRSATALLRAGLLAVLLAAAGLAVAERSALPSPPPVEALDAEPAAYAARAVPEDSFEEAGKELAAGDLGAARRSYDDLLAAARHRGDVPSKVRALTGLGIVFSRAGDLEQAERTDREALRLARTVGDQVRIGALLNNLGVVLVRQGRLPEAEKHYREAATVYGAMDAVGPEAAAINNTAQMLRRQGHLEEAGNAFERALELRLAAGDRRGEGVTLLGIARLSLDRGRPDEARESFETAIALFREVGHPDGVVEGLLGAAEAALAAGHRTAAGRALDRATALAGDAAAGASERREGWWADVLRLRADALLAEGSPGRMAEAIDLANRSLLSCQERYDEEGRVRSGLVLARALVAAGRAPEARDLLDRLDAPGWAREDRELRTGLARVRSRIREPAEAGPAHLAALGGGAGPAVSRSSP